ncbi:MAG TPA: (d)CMP kinase, partial [Dongiaceae bacterium]|nr:(d)CMP kinase [Dongiaceae bacterium]
MNFVIAIDGPSGAGKSSTARGVARRLGILYLDTGALYRALALRVLTRGVPVRDEAAVDRCASEARIDLAGSPDDAHVLLDGQDVSREIRTPEVSEMASRLATLSGVRRQLVELQRAFARRGPIVAEGRDLGTVVFPGAQVKVFLDADLGTRAERRTRELHGRGLAVARDDVREDLQRRDERDQTRADSPLRRADNAHVLDTTGLSLDQQIEAVLA